MKLQFDMMPDGRLRVTKNGVYFWLTKAQAREIFEELRRLLYWFEEHE